MKKIYDKGADATYIYLKDNIFPGEIKRTISFNKEINLDFDNKDGVIGI